MNAITRWSLYAVLIVVGGLVAYGAARATSSPTVTSADLNRMAPLDVAKLDAAMGHIREANRVCQDAQSSVRVDNEEVKAAFAKYHIAIDPEGRIRDAIDFHTGIITRAVISPAPSVPAKKP